MKKLLLATSLFTSAILMAQPTSWSIKGVGGGGALFRPTINPGNPNEYYVPTDMGSFFHTTDLGKSYTEINFHKLSGGAGGTMRFTNNAAILYAIGFTPADGGGLFKTIDGGNTWLKLPCTSTITDNFVSLFVDYNNPNHLVFATPTSMSFSSDGGATKLDITQSIPSYQYISGCFFEGTNIYMGTPGGVIVSTNSGMSFSKANLTGLAANYDIVGFAAAKQGATIRFFCSTMPTGTAVDQIFAAAGGYQNTYINNVYSVDYNSSTVWTQRSNGITLPTSNGCYPCHYVIWLGMAENDINTVYAGGVNGNSQAMMLKTSDAGGTWNDIFKIIGNINIKTGYAGYHGDLWQWYNGFDCMEVCPTNSNVVVHTSMGYIHVTKDGGVTWDQAYDDAADTNPMNTDTPKNKDYHTIGIEPTTNWYATWADANKMIYSVTDIGCLLSSDGGTGWHFPSNFTYNTLYRAIKHSSGTVYGAVSNIHDLYTNGLQDKPIDNSSYSNGEIMYSNDNGYTWATLHNFARPVYWIEMDVNNPNKMYASVVNHTQGLGGIYYTTDLNNGTSSTWTKLSNPPRTEGHPAKIVSLKDGKIVCTYSCRQTDWTDSPSGKFTRSSGVFIYDFGNSTWTDVTDLNSTNPISGTNTGTMGWWCNDIYVDPNDPTENTWYVGVSAGYGWTDATGLQTPNDLGALMKTTNRGQTWTTILSEANGISPGGGVFSCALNPNDPNEMFVATTRDGLIVSKNINSSTPTFTNVQTFQFGFPVRILFNPYNQNEMWVTTFGNGIHVGMLPTGINEKDVVEHFSVYPNPTNDMIYVSADKTLGNYTITNALGETVEVGVSITNNQQLSTLNYPNGVYFLRFGTACKKIIVNH